MLKLQFIVPSILFHNYLHLFLNPSYQLTHYLTPYLVPNPPIPKNILSSQLFPLLPSITWHHIQLIFSSESLFLQLTSHSISVLFAFLFFFNPRSSEILNFSSLFFLRCFKIHLCQKFVFFIFSFIHRCFSDFKRHNNFFSFHTFSLPQLFSIYSFSSVFFFFYIIFFFFNVQVWYIFLALFILLQYFPEPLELRFVSPAKGKNIFQALESPLPHFHKARFILTFPLAVFQFFLPILPPVTSRCKIHLSTDASLQSIFHLEYEFSYLLCVGGGKLFVWVRRRKEDDSDFTCLQTKAT